MSTGADEFAIELNEVTRRMGGEYILRGINLEVAPGRLVVLRGSNGTGKTTLLRLLATRLRPASGRALVFGHDLTREAAAARARLGLLTVLGGSFPLLTGRENLELATTLAPRRLGEASPAGTAHSNGPQARTVTADGEASHLAALARVGLEHAAGKLVRTYSSGMKKRLGLARLLLLDPDLWLLDEPYAALDDSGKRLMDECVAAAKARGRTVFMASHESDRDHLGPDAVIELKDGTLRVFGA